MPPDILRPLAIDLWLALYKMRLLVSSSIYTEDTKKIYSEGVEKLFKIFSTPASDLAQQELCFLFWSQSCQEYQQQLAVFDIKIRYQYFDYCLQCLFFWFNNHLELKDGDKASAEEAKILFWKQYEELKKTFSSQESPIIQYPLILLIEHISILCIDTLPAQKILCLQQIAIRAIQLFAMDVGVPIQNANTNDLLNNIVDVMQDLLFSHLVFYDTNSVGDFLQALQEYLILLFNPQLPVSQAELQFHVSLQLPLHKAYLASELEACIKNTIDKLLKLGSIRALMTADLLLQKFIDGHFNGSQDKGIVHGESGQQLIVSSYERLMTAVFSLSKIQPTEGQQIGISKLIHFIRNFRRVSSEDSKVCISMFIIRCLTHLLRYSPDNLDAYIAIYSGLQQELLENPPAT